MSIIHHAFAGRPLRSPANPAETLKNSLLADEANHKVLPFTKGKPLVQTLTLEDDNRPKWALAYLPPSNLKNLIDSFVFLGEQEEDDGAGVAYWAVDVLDLGGDGVDLGGGRDKGFCFVELRTLMVATDWNDGVAMAQLAIAGHARALLEWHGTSRFCGNCGAGTKPIDAGRRKQCTNESCKKRIYPRVDPVVIMLVIDRENDRALLSRQSRFVPRMWSCLAGFIEPGETLEEAVRRETWEETGIEVGEVVYHSSQPWPVGPSSMPCQLMVGFLAYAKSFDIRVDKKELEDAKWHGREDVKKALDFAEYEKAQRTAASKVNQMCKGVERGGQSLSSDFNVESGELATMFVPGPFAIAHHLISSWVNKEATEKSEMLSKANL